MSDTLILPPRNDCTIILWICKIKTKDKVISDSPLTELGIQDIDVSDFFFTCAHTFSGMQSFYFNGLHAIKQLFSHCLACFSLERAEWTD